MFVASRCHALLLRPCFIRACSSTGVGGPASKSVTTAYSNALKDLQGLQAEKGALDVQKFERMLRFCAYSPALKSAAERSSLVKSCTELAEQKELLLTVNQHNFILQAYVVAEVEFSCAHYLDSMAKTGVAANADTYHLCTLAECSAGNVDAALAMIEHLKSEGHTVKELVYSALIETYCRLGYSSKAFRMMDALLASNDMNVTATSYLALLRGAARYAEPKCVSAALSKLPENRSVLLDPDQYKKLISLTGMENNAQSLNLLLSCSKPLTGGAITGLANLLPEFLSHNCIQSCHVLLAYLTAGGQAGDSQPFAVVDYFINLVETCGRSFSDRMQVLVGVHQALPSAQVANRHLLQLIDGNSSPLDISMCLAHYMQATVAVNFDVMQAIRHKLESERCVASIAKWISGFQQHRMHVADWLWYALVYVAADTTTPVPEVLQLMSTLQMDIFTTACVLKSIESCSRALPSSQDYLTALRAAVSNIPPVMSSQPANDSTTDAATATASAHGHEQGEACERKEDVNLESVLADIDALVPSSVQEAASLLESALPSLMMTNVKDAFLLAAHVCDQRPEVARAVSVSCLHALLTALHDGALPLHFFRFALALRSADVLAPERWLHLSLSMHILMDHSTAVDDIYAQMLAQVSGDVAGLAKGLVIKVFRYWLSSNRPNDVINNYSKLTDPAASDGSILGIVISAYIALGDADNATFFMEKSISGKSRPSQKAMADVMDMHCGQNKPDTAWALYQNMMQAGVSPSARAVATLTKLLVSHERYDDVSSLLTQTRVNSLSVSGIVFRAYITKGHLTAALKFAIAHPVKVSSLRSLCAAPFKLPGKELQDFMTCVHNHRAPPFRHLFQQLFLVMSLMKNSSDSEVTSVLTGFQQPESDQLQMIQDLVEAACGAEGAEPVAAVFRLMVLLHRLDRPVATFAELFLDGLAKADRREAALALLQFAQSANIKWSAASQLSLQQLGISSAAATSSAAAAAAAAGAGSGGGQHAGKTSASSSTAQ